MGILRFCNPRWAPLPRQRLLFYPPSPAAFLARLGASEREGRQSGWSHPSSSCIAQRGQHVTFYQTSKLRPRRRTLWSFYLFQHVAKRCAFPTVAKVRIDSEPFVFWSLLTERREEKTHSLWFGVSPEKLESESGGEVSVAWCWSGACCCSMPPHSICGLCED